MEDKWPINDLGWCGPVSLSRKQAFELIPTWQRGLKQPPDDDLETFARSGYGRDSLIYACISELATSAARCPLTMLRAAADGEEEIPQHSIFDLLAAPNDEMDFSMFIETYVTYLMITGNVYLEKVRVGRGVDRLGFLRPDRIEIQPAERKEDVRASSTTSSLIPSMTSMGSRLSTSSSVRATLTSA